MNRLAFFRIVKLLLLLLIGNLLFGQKTNINQDIIWNGFVSTFEMDDKWTVQNEIHERYYINPVAQHQFLIRSHVHRELGNSAWETSIGMCLFFQSPNNPNAAVRLTIPELRPHLEFTYKQGLKSLTIEHRYRAETRFFQNTNQEKTELEAGFYYGNIRLRYRLQAIITLAEFKRSQYVRLKIGDEIHLNAANQVSNSIFDQNRILGSVNFDLSQSTSLELGYINWFQQINPKTFFNRNILSLMFAHKMVHKANRI